MTLTELTNIIQETIDATEEDLETYADLAHQVIAVTIQVMDVLKGLSLEMSTRDLTYARLVQQIVAKVREREGNFS